MNKPSRVKFSENRQHLRNSPVRPLAGGRNPPPLLLRPARTATCRLLFPLAILETRCLKALRGGVSIERGRTALRAIPARVEAAAGNLSPRTAHGLDGGVVGPRPQYRQEG